MAAGPGGPDDDAKGLPAAIDPDDALVELLRRLRAASYAFVAPGRRTLAGGRVRRVFHHGDPLQDVFGWNKTFLAERLDPVVFEWMRSSGILRRRPFGRWRSMLRVSSLGPALVGHSPLNAGVDAVFFGPDSYRFARFLEDAAEMLPRHARVVDLGCGAGAGAIALGAARPDLRLVLVDVNPAAVRLARANIAAAGLEAELVTGDGLAAVDGPIDAVVANPPFLGGGLRGTYRDGGSDLGSAVPLAWVRSATARMASSGTILLFSGTAIAAGEDRLGDTLERELTNAGFAVRYRELDPDVYGDMLWRPAYRGVDRIALVTLIAAKGD